MPKPAVPANEEERLAALHELHLLDTPREERFDRITRLAMDLLGAPVAFVSLVDANRQWFKSCVGLGLSETPRDVSFCGHTILGDEPLVVPDARKDARFSDNPFVVGEPGIRFYAGYPLRGPRGLKVGTLCVVDQQPQEFGEAKLRVLQDLAALAERELNLVEAMTLQQELLAARAAEKELLLCILPKPIAERLRTSPGIIADSFSEATILFAHLHDFDRLTAGMPPVDMVRLLNEVFSRFDALMHPRGLEKIKTMGDAYMAAAGVPVPRADHAEAMADLALAMQQEVVRFEAPGGETFSLRIGLDSGPVIAGVIGTTKFSYDLWGATVGTAWEMAAYGAPGCIQVVESTYERLREKYLFEERGEFYLKGRGDVRTYFLKGRRQPPNRLR